MALETNNPALEFETMLRRHLKSGGAPVSACAGLEADTVSAYLEDALNGTARASFEAHLAGCPACRRHVIELFRLSQTVTQTATARDIGPSLSADSPLWSRWQSAVAARFNNRLDLSTWRWNWRLAGASIMAVASLIAVIVIQPWRRGERLMGDGPQSAKVAVADPSPTAAAQAEPLMAMALPSPSPMPEQKQQLSPPPNAGAPEAEAYVNSNGDQEMLARNAKAPVPAPKVNVDPGKTISSIGGIVGVPSDRYVTLDRPSQEGVAPPAKPTLPTPPEQNALRLQQPTNALSGGLNEVAALANKAPESPSRTERREEQRTQEKRENSPRIAASSVDNPMRPAQPMQDAASDPKRTRTEGARSDKDSERGGGSPSLFSRILSGLVPGGKGEPEPKPEPGPELRPERSKDESEQKDVAVEPRSEVDESRSNAGPALRRESARRRSAKAPGTLVMTVSDKTFLWERNERSWVDQEFKPETMGRGFIDVQDGTQEYERIVAEEPALKEYFNIGRNVGRRVIVVWKQKIYRLSRIIGR